MNGLFILNGSTANRGCEAILLSTYDLFRAADPSAEMINSSLKDPRTGTEAYLDLPGLLHRCHPEPRTVQFLQWQAAKRLRGLEYNFERFLPWANMVLSLGGDNYSLDYDSVDKYLDGNDRVLASRRPLVIWGASVGPFTAQPEVERRVAEQFRRLHLVVVRERQSVAYLASLGIEENVVLLPDPAFALRSVPALLPELQERMVAQGAIGLNLSPLLARYRNGMTQWTDDAAGWVRALLATQNRPVLLIPHVFEPGNDDQQFLADVLRQVGAPPERLALLDGRGLSCMQLKHVIGRLHLFIGARTHATIAAMSKEIPVLSIGYSMKAQGINEDVFGSDRWIVSHKGLTADALAAKVAELDSAAPEVRAALALRMQDYRMRPSDIASLPGLGPLMRSRVA